MELTGREWCFYTPWSKYQEQVDLDQCRYHVWDEKPPFIDHQCIRKAHEYIDGFGFCRQHAKIVRAWKEKHKDG